MESSQIRLELVKLTYSHGKPAKEAVERAKELEAYVLGSSQTEPIKSEVTLGVAPTVTASRGKKADNPTPLK